MSGYSHRKNSGIVMGALILICPRKVGMLTYVQYHSPSGSAGGLTFPNALARQGVNVVTATLQNSNGRLNGGVMADPSYDRELKNALAQIEKQFGKGAIMQL